MTAIAHVAGLLKEFGDRLDEPMTLDEDGCCVLPIEEDRELMIVVSDADDAILFCVNVAPLIDDAPSDLLRHLLILNFTDTAIGGATLGLTADGEEVVLRYSRAVESLRLSDIDSIIGHLTDTARRLATVIADWQVRASANPANAEDDVIGGQEGLPDFA